MSTPIQYNRNRLPFWYLPGPLRLPFLLPAKVLSKPLDKTRTLGGSVKVLYKTLAKNIGRRAWQGTDPRNFIKGKDLYLADLRIRITIEKYSSKYQVINIRYLLLPVPGTRRLSRLWLQAQKVAYDTLLHGINI